MEEIDYQIIWKVLNNIASPKEQEQVDVWKSTNVDHRKLYDHLRKTQSETTVSGSDLERNWNRLKQSLKSRSKSGYLMWLRYASALILPLTVAVGFLLFHQPKVSNRKDIALITPGKSQAVLKMSDGSSIVLDTNIKKTIFNKKGLEISKVENDQIKYNNTKIKKVQYNTLTVPRGGQYQVELSDGTKVWLNSASELKFPVAFTGNTREVQLRGEAYFEVAPDKNREFTVKMGNSVVHVYGTKFNVMNYDDYSEQQLTLVEGSVAFTKKESKVVLKPNEQLRFDKQSEKSSVLTVDTRLYTDWTNGIFRYENMAIQDVAAQLSRWYDVDFFFANEEIKTRKITGAIKRTTNFHVFMKLLEKFADVDVKISEDEKAVVITAKY